VAGDVVAANFESRMDYSVVAGASMIRATMPLMRDPAIVSLDLALDLVVGRGCSNT